MSFSSDVKTELCRDREALSQRSLALAEAYGILLYANSFTTRLIRVITQNDALCARLPKLFRRAFGLDFDILPPTESTGRRSFVIDSAEKILAVFDAFGHDPSRTVSQSINLAVIEDDAHRTAFLRGAFLAGGSVTDPAKRYHLELSTTHAGVSRGMHALLLEMDFTPHDITRGASFITYFKQSGAIEDILTKLGASGAAMYIMQTKVDKDFSSVINRRTNCDMANADKITDAAQRQLQLIRALEAGPGLESLPPVLQDTALLRIANPSCSLADLAQLAIPPVTKSCMGHRLKKLTDLAESMLGPSVP